MWRDLGGPERFGAAIRRCTASIRLTKLRPDPTWPPLRALLTPATPTPLPAPTPGKIWTSGWGVRLRLGGREKANARALERGVVLLESNESQFTLRGEGVHLRR